MAREPIETPEQHREPIEKSHIPTEQYLPSRDEDEDSGEDSDG